jgi:hypothetical protein
MAVNKTGEKNHKYDIKTSKTRIVKIEQNGKTN